MAPSKLKKAIGRVKDQTKISLAKYSGSTSLSDLDIAIVKATNHEEHPADDRYFREIVCITSYSRAYIIACVNTLSKRLNKTKSWTVALKSLMLIQRLLEEGDPAYQQEFFFSTRRGTRILNLSDFRDATRNNSWDFSAFVRTYALYLDERLEYKVQDRRGDKPYRMTSGKDEEEEEEEEGNDKENAGKTSHFHDMMTEQIFTTLLHLQQLLERFLACRPTGAAKYHRVVTVALYQIVKESFQLYNDITEILAIYTDRLTELDLPESLNAYNIFCRQGKQLDELDNFYSWCKTAGIGQASAYPEIEKITQKKLDFIDELVRDKKSAAQQNDDDLPKAKPEAIEDVNVVKALPALKENEEGGPVEKEPEKGKEGYDPKPMVVQREFDYFNLGKNAMSSEEQTDEFMLALIDDGVPAGPPPGSGWECFEDEADWESALIQSGSYVNHQKADLGGGLLMLDGMNQQGQSMKVIPSQDTTTRSASSITFGSAVRPELLALPTPPSPYGRNTGSDGIGDPFVASFMVSPPSYVQMSDMEKQQRFLEAEVTMWEQYQRNGFQGNVGMWTVQTSAYNQGEHRF